MIEKNRSDEMLAATAYWTAAVRALENKREDPLITDPWAERLAGEAGAVWLGERTEASVLPIVIRTRYFDDFLQRVVLEYAVRQVVLLAAGLDTRAWRLAWPEGIRFFEVDQPAVVDYKTDILQEAGTHPGCIHQAIKADLTDRWGDKLIEAGYEVLEPSVWLLEGFLFYVPRDAISRIIADVTQLAAPGSWLGFDIINNTVLTSPLTRPWVQMQAKSGAAWIGAMDDPVGFLAASGWQAKLTQAGQPDANYDRWTLPIMPTTMPEMPHNWFVTATRTA